MPMKLVGCRLPLSLSLYLSVTYQVGCMHGWVWTSHGLVFGIMSQQPIELEELDWHIESILSEIQEKSAQVVKLEKEISALKASLAPINGVAFMCRIEENPVWAAVDSQEFNSQFLRHELPEVVNVAILVKRAHRLKEECRELTQRLEQLRESQRRNKYSPVELLRLIEDLRKENVLQRTEIVTLREEIATLRNEVLSLREETGHKWTN